MRIIKGLTVEVELALLVEFSLALSFNKAKSLE